MTELKCYWCGETKEELQKALENAEENYMYVSEINFFDCLAVDDSNVDRGIVCNNCIATWMIEDPRIDILELRAIKEE